MRPRFAHRSSQILPQESAGHASRIQPRCLLGFIGTFASELPYSLQRSLFLRNPVKLETFLSALFSIFLLEKGN